jgi:hypothetical protein
MYEALANSSGSLLEARILAFGLIYLGHVEGDLQELLVAKQSKPTKPGNTHA